MKFQISNKMFSIMGLKVILMMSSFLINLKKGSILGNRNGLSQLIMNAIYVLILLMIFLLIFLILGTSIYPQDENYKTF